MVVLLHTPPETELPKVTVAPLHTTDGPDIVPALGAGFTVTSVVTVLVPQVLVKVQVMVAVPLATPCTTLAEAMVATDVLLDDQVPPPTVSPNVMLLPTQTLVLPVMAARAGSGFTVMALVTVLLPQALLMVYDIVVLPAATPDTVPEPPTLAIAVLLLAHVPPVTVFANAVDALWQTLVAPVIEAGVAGLGLI